jgi:hypothetical protein
VSVVEATLLYDGVPGVPGAGGFVTVKVMALDVVLFDVTMICVDPAGAAAGTCTQISPFAQPAPLPLHAPEPPVSATKSVFCAYVEPKETFVVEVERFGDVGHVPPDSQKWLPKICTTCPG